MTFAPDALGLRRPQHLVVLRGAEAAGWIAIGVMVAMAVPVMVAHGLAFDWRSAAPPSAATAGFLAGAAVYRTWRPDERIATSLVAIAQLIAFTAVAETLSYAVATFGAPLWDSAFLAWDRALGFDWLAYLTAVDARPWLAAVFGLAYKSLLVQFVVAAAALGLAGHLAACRTFVLAVVLAGLATVLISGVMPAVSVFVHLGLHAGDYPRVDSIAGYAPIVPFEALRAGTLRVISLQDGEGIIAFPSFHAALGVIFIRAFWPLRRLRWPAVALNLVVLASTPVNGGHYLVDVIAGVTIAVSAVFAAHALEARAAP